AQGVKALPKGEDLTPVQIQTRFQILGEMIQHAVELLVDLEDTIGLAPGSEPIDHFRSTWRRGPPPEPYGIVALQNVDGPAKTIENDSDMAAPICRYLLDRLDSEVNAYQRQHLLEALNQTVRQWIRPVQGRLQQDAAEGPRCPVPIATLRENYD